MALCGRCATLVTDLEDDMPCPRGGVVAGAGRSVGGGVHAVVTALKADDEGPYERESTAPG